jgi:hypothetical protein
MAANPASLPHPKKCSNPLHCERRPQCFTNYEPLFEPSMALAAISVGSTGWKYAPGECRTCVVTIAASPNEI